MTGINYLWYIMSNLFNLPIQPPAITKTTTTTRIQQNQQNQQQQQSEYNVHRSRIFCFLTFVYLFCLCLANCIMKMSINFPTICHRCVCAMLSYRPALTPTQTHTHTHKHTQMPVTLNANCKLSSSAGGKYWHDRRIFILFYLHFYFTLCFLYAPTSLLSRS